MELETYETVRFKDRLMQAIGQIRAVDKKMEERVHSLASSAVVPSLVEEKFLEQCLNELRDSQDTLLILQKEVFYYIT